MKQLTIGSHPTTSPPPTPLPFCICTGRFAQRATTGYAFAVPNDESLVLSAYRMKQNGLAPSGIADC